MKRLSLLSLVLILGTSPSIAWENEEDLKSAAATWLKQQTAFIPCGERNFIYGVGYIDGSYMERIFYVDAGSSQPDLSVHFRDSQPGTGSSEQDVDGLSFVLEMRVPAARAALPVNGKWKLAPEGWETALRFKYTSWFGTINRQEGQWTARWDGYRRPMLPDRVLKQPAETCRLFAGP